MGLVSDTLCLVMNVVWSEFVGVDDWNLELDDSGYSINVFFNNKYVGFFFVVEADSNFDIVCWLDGVMFLKEGFDRRYEFSGCDPDFGRKVFVLFNGNLGVVA